MKLTDVYVALLDQDRREAAYPGYERVKAELVIGRDTPVMFWGPYGDAEVEIHACAVLPRKDASLQSAVALVPLTAPLKRRADDPPYDTIIANLNLKVELN
jgi:hypothetical protein